MAKKLSPNKLIIEKQKQAQKEKEEENEDKIFKDKKVQEIEVPKSKSLDKIDQIWAHLEGQDFQFESIVQDLHDLKVKCHENFKYIHNEFEIIKKQNEKLHYILDKIYTNIENIIKSLESKNINKKENKENIEMNLIAPGNILQTILDKTGKSIMEIEKLIEKKIEDVRFISRDGALNLIAHDFGIKIKEVN